MDCGTQPDEVWPRAAELGVRISVFERRLSSGPTGRSGSTRPVTLTQRAAGSLASAEELTDIATMTRELSRQARTDASDIQQQLRGPGTAQRPRDDRAVGRDSV